MYKSLALGLGLALAFAGLAPAADDFDSAGWETNTNYYKGDPSAQKGGELRYYWSEFPVTLRTNGPNSNAMQTREIHGMMFESLIAIHPDNLETLPSLATHWKVSQDKRQFWFRINPAARWADGTEVTAEDVVASWEFRVWEEIKDPYSLILYRDSYEKPVAESKYIVSVKTKKLHWRLFLYFGGMDIYNAKELRSFKTGDEYLEMNWKLQMGTGPYILKPEDIKMDQALSIARRTDYWGENEPSSIGFSNFDKVTWIVIRDETIAFEKFKKGEIDYYYVSKAHRWRNECDFDEVKKGWVQKRKIYTEKPEGYSGFVFNMRKPPFDDRNIRKAFCHLFNRERLFDTLFYNEYDFLDSYWPGTIWGNPGNPKIRYNPRRAARLLEKAGWKDRNEDGWLVKDGKIFELELEYGWDPYTRIFSLLKEDIEKAGIKFTLKLIDPRTLATKMDAREFTIGWAGWGAILWPNPESSWMSDLADKETNNNWPGFKNAEVDKLCKEYDLEFDRKKQIEIVRKIDKIIFTEHPYALAWSANFDRILYWDKFGHPPTYFSRIGDSLSIKGSWWFDAKKKAALEEAMKTGAQLPVGDVVQKPFGEKKVGEEPADGDEGEKD